MADQMRFNGDKPKLSYWLSTQAAATYSLGPPEVNMIDMNLCDLDGALGNFCRGETHGGNLLVAVVEYVWNVGESVPVLYSNVCAFGESKYARGNFRKGAPVSQYIDSAARHLKAMQEGQDTDPESGHRHIAHVLWNVVQVFEIMNTDAKSTRDDRLFHHGDMSGVEK